MKRISQVLFLTCLGILLLAQVASAKTFSMPPLPEFSVPVWESGTSVTYDTVYSGSDGNLAFNVRFAVLDKEMDGNTPLYWVEIDILDITVQPPDLINPLITGYYGQEPRSIRLMILMPEYDFVTLFTDPSKCYYDFTEPGFIRSMYFQYNEFVPYDVDPSLIPIFLPIAVSDRLGDELPEDFLTDRNLGIQIVPDSENFIYENCESEITVGAGAFEGYRFEYSSRAGNSGAGMIFHTDTTPIIPIVTLTANWMGGTAMDTIAMELIQVEHSDASTQLTYLDQAILMDLQELMYGS